MDMSLRLFSPEKTGLAEFGYPRQLAKLQEGVRVPWLQLKGHWLDRAGFAIDTPVSVRVMEGCLVLIAACDKVD